MFILKMLRFFLPFSLDPQEGRICASSHFVATSIFPRWGQMGTNVICRTNMLNSLALAVMLKKVEVMLLLEVVGVPLCFPYIKPSML